jgi:hypothetical protein
VKGVAKIRAYIPEVNSLFWIRDEVEAVPLCPILSNSGRNIDQTRIRGKSTIQLAIVPHRSHCGLYQKETESQNDRIIRESQFQFLRRT